MAFSDPVLDRHENPRNAGKMDANDEHVGTGMVGAPAWALACSTSSPMRLWWWTFRATLSIWFPNATDRRTGDMRWTDGNDLAIELADAHPDVDPLAINFVDLRNRVLALPEIDDDPNYCGEKILEAIRAAWIEERDGALLGSKIPHF